jgi:hypothetical protein
MLHIILWNLLGIVTGYISGCFFLSLLWQDKVQEYFKERYNEQHEVMDN